MELFVKQIFLYSILFSGVSFEFFGRHFNIERIVYVILLVPVSLYFLTVLTNKNAIIEQRSKSVYISAILWPICLLLSSIFSNDFASHLPGLVISLAPSLVYYIFSTGQSPETIIRKNISIILWVVSISTIFTYSAWLLLGSNIVENMVDSDGRVKLMTFEPNILGSLIGYLWILHFPYFKKALSCYILYVLVFLSLVFTFSKAPYLAFFAAFVLYMYLNGYTKKIKHLSIIIPFILLLIIVIDSNGVEEFYNIYLNREDSLDSRMIGLNIAWARFVNSIWLGNGPLDFSLHPDLIIYLIGSNLDSDAWIWQMIVAILHDTGIIGLLCYLIWLFVVFSKSIKNYFVTKSKHDASYIASFFLLLIASQATTVHLTATFGMAFGILASIAVIKNEGDYCNEIEARGNKTNYWIGLSGRQPTSW